MSAPNHDRESFFRAIEAAPTDPLPKAQFSAWLTDCGEDIEAYYWKTSSRQDISRLAGRELDALVAERVMGWRDLADGCFAVDSGHRGGPYMTNGLNGTNDRGAPSQAVPCYSEDLVAAWTVVERLADQGILTSVCWGRYGLRTTKVATVQTLPDVLRGASAVADTAPLAICRAALMTLLES